MSDYRGGGIKTSIFLFSILIIITLLLFLFVQNIYVDSKNQATNSLMNANDCIDISFDIMGYEYSPDGVDIIISNKENSILIQTLHLNYEYNDIVKDTSIIPGEIKSVNFDINSTGLFDIYPNNCINYAKKIEIK
ncbi:hypothetical protein C0585_06130 [Candidatus Woesearchaeota archaeon]|nr:MAG: hypothetical protein C0585_06130 [Candidatus Woesearchaeota archaeon]